MVIRSHPNALIQLLNGIAVDVGKKGDEIAKTVARTAMTGKSVGGQREYLADIAVKAVNAVAEKADGKVDR